MRIFKMVLSSICSLRSLRQHQLLNVHNSLPYFRLSKTALLSTLDKIVSNDISTDNDELILNSDAQFLPPTPRVLSIQSHTVHGYVGKSVVGLEWSFYPSLLFTNRLCYVILYYR
jgi:hypothetical protein